MNHWLDFLKSEGAVLNASGADGAPAVSRVARFENANASRAASERDKLVCALPDWVAVSIIGPDATAFLQGQFTNDVEALAAGSVQFNGYCSPKGRMLANFPLARLADGSYLLVVPADIAAAVVRRLRMFVLRSKVQVTALDTTHACIGLHHAGAPEHAPGTLQQTDEMSIVALPDGRMLAICPLERAPEVWRQFARTAAPVGEPVWDRLAIEAGIPTITAATQDRFVPQMLNWELIGGVSFRKGCYPGQEIVARMQYLGRLQERLYRARVAADDVAPGSPL